MPECPSRSAYVTRLSGTQCEMSLIRIRLYLNYCLVVLLFHDAVVDSFDEEGGQLKGGKSTLAVLSSLRVRMGPAKSVFKASESLSSHNNLSVAALA